MSRKKVKSEIKRLKSELKLVNRATDIRLIKLSLLMLILVIIVAFMTGKIQL